MESKSPATMSTLTCDTSNMPPVLSHPAAQPRRISAAEVLAERAELRREIGYCPHGVGGNYFWVYCDCPNCADYYDPTGEERAKYLNMDLSSFYITQSDMPSFAFSKIAKESLLFASTPGFYFNSDARVRDLTSFLSQMTPPLALYPKAILHIGTDRVWDRYIFSEETGSWTRHTWKRGMGVWDPATVAIPHDLANEGIRAELVKRHGNV